MEATAQLNSYRQSPRKVRLVADAIRGKKVSKAKDTLAFMAKRGALPMTRLLDSAIANAKTKGISADDLVVKSIEVNQGDILYRRMPVAHGASHPIRKRMSHIKIVLGELKDGKKQKSKN
jgi:large subunit ribosomal protein L22